MKSLPTLIFSSLTFLLWACTKEKPSHPELQAGDILFQELACGELCEAINEVTEGYGGRDFAHCALVVKIGDSLKVVEAIGNQVQLNSLENFAKRSADTLTWERILVARVQPKYKALLPKAQDAALSYLGLAYDDAFLPNNGKLYCSEVLYEAFKTANEGADFFPLSPMTFKSPKTQQFFPAWVEYYAKLQDSIPEGKLGLNPGKISRSEKLEIVEE